MEKRIFKYWGIIIAALLILLLSITCDAQLVGSNAFIKGTYVEIGVNECGAYGSDNPAPAGYHDNVWSGLGFVADSDMDGWATGTPDYCGDYFVPGSPVEGWQIQIGPTVYTNTDQFCSPFGIPGSITDYSYIGGIYTVTWDGNIAAYDLSVNQITTLGEDNLYFVTRILLCNDGIVPINNLYYKRNVDPDQDQPWGGGFSTDNTVVYQPPIDPKSLVTSEGLTYGCFLGLGAKDINSRVSYGNFSTTDGTPKQVWDGTGGYYDSGSSTGDIANSIAFYIDTILPGECKCIAFAYILDEIYLDTALDETIAEINVTADSIDITSTGTTYICPGDSTLLTIVNNTDYEWVWTPATGLNVDSGYVVWASPDTTTMYIVTGTGTCGFMTKMVTVVVNPVAVANAGPDVGVCPTDTVTLYGSGGVLYEWQPPIYIDDINNDTANVMNPLTDMYYDLIVTDINGCIDTDQVYVDLYPVPIIDAGDDVIIETYGTTQLEATGGISYEWCEDSTLSELNIFNPWASPSDTTVYCVMGTDINGCISIDSVIVFVITPVTYVTPNAFSPNGDGLNDYYMPHVTGYGSLLNFHIYNRWGQLIYTWADTYNNTGWDGTYNNIQQEIDMYIVLITLMDDYSNSIVTKSTTLTLIR